MNLGLRKTWISALVAASAGLASLLPTASAAQVNYVITPTVVSPLHGALIHDHPQFMEPALLRTDHGFATAFIENAGSSSATPPRAGWSCYSATGASWSCSELSDGPGGGDWADPWLADTHGDPCHTYGHAISLAALRKGPGDVLEPISYYSLDYGKTWVGPVTLPYPEGVQIPIADGTKLIYTGRTYEAWRDYTFATGEYISQLQPNCSWGVPARLTTTVGYDGSDQFGYDDGSDHPRLAATPEHGGLAARGSFDDNVLTFHRFDQGFKQEAESIIAPAGPSEDYLEFCPTDSVSTCPQVAEDLGQTLLYVPRSREYLAVWDQRDLGGPNPDGIGLYFSRSIDDGLTWSSPVELAGPSVDGSYVTMQPTMTYDKTTGDALLTYLENPRSSSTSTHMQLRWISPGAAASWGTPETVRTFDWDLNATDYYSMVASGAVADIAHSMAAPSGGGEIEFMSVRYAPAP